MTYAIESFPKVGSLIPYRDALASYDELENYLLSKVYSEPFLGKVRMYDLIWELDSVASKCGVRDSRELNRAQSAMHEYVSERTALANGVNGTRFRLQGNKEALEQHDQTHLFRVGIDGEKLLSSVESALSLISKELDGSDEYADTYSPECPELNCVVEPRSSLMDKWFLRIIAFLCGLFAGGSAVHAMMSPIPLL